MPDRQTDKAIAALVAESFTLEAVDGETGVLLTLRCVCCDSAVWRSTNGHARFNLNVGNLLLLTTPHVYMCPKAMGSEFTR